MPTLPSALIRQTSPLDAPADENEPESTETPEVQEARPSVKARRTRPVKSSEKTSKRGLYLNDGLWEKLQLEAIRKRSNVSAVVTDYLERSLPKLRIERDV